MTLAVGTRDSVNPSGRLICDKRFAMCAQHDEQSLIDVTVSALYMLCGSSS